METFLSQFFELGVKQPPAVLFVLMAIVFAGALITSGFGVGGGVIMTPLVILLLPPKLGIALLGPLMLLSSGAGVRQYWRQWDNRIVWVLLPASLCGVWFGTYLLAVVSPAVVKKTVGVLSFAFGILQFLIIDRPEWRNRLRPPPWQGVGFGFASGITTALAHTGGIVFSFYLLPHSRTKEAFVGTTVFLFFASGWLKIGTYAYYQILTLPILLFSILFIPALLLGAVTGKWLNRRISNQIFMKVICLFIAGIGLRLLAG
jgi:uncharacterized membrane protein YfcA